MHTYCDPNHLALPPLQCPTVLRRRLASKILSLLGFYYVSPFENCFDPITGNLETCYCDIRLMWLQDQIRTLHFDIFSKEKQCAEETDVHGFFSQVQGTSQVEIPVLWDINPAEQYWLFNTSKILVYRRNICWHILTHHVSVVSVGRCNRSDRSKIGPFLIPLIMTMQYIAYGVSCHHIY